MDLSYQSKYMIVGIVELTIAFVLLYTKEHVLFVCEQTCEQLIDPGMNRKR